MRYKRTNELGSSIPLFLYAGYAGVSVLTIILNEDKI